jgi:hypothetical protein
MTVKPGKRVEVLAIITDSGTGGAEFRHEEN